MDQGAEVGSESGMLHSCLRNFIAADRAVLDLTFPNPDLFIEHAVIDFRIIVHHLQRVTYFVNPILYVHNASSNQLILLPTFKQ